MNRLPLTLALLGALAALPAMGNANELLRQQIETAERSVGEALATIAQARNSEGKRGAGSPEQARLAAAELEKVAALLNSDSFQRLQGGVQQLFGKSVDVSLDAIGAHAAAGQTGKAAALLNGPLKHMLIPGIDKYFNQPSLASLQDVAEFKRYRTELVQPARMGTRSVLATPYREQLSDTEKVAGLSLFWAEVRRSFVHFSQNPELDWDAVYVEYLPKVLATKSVREYYDVLMTVAPRLRDAHTNIGPPPQLHHLYFSKPPLRTAMVNGQVLVTSVHAEALASSIQAGDELVAIDGLTVKDYAEQRVAPLVHASTPQDREVRLYGYQLLSGEKGSSLRLTVKGADGKERSVTTRRGDPEDRPLDNSPRIRDLANGLVYISLTGFEGPASLKLVETNLDRIMQAKGLVIDLRNNGGGSSNIGYDILSYLTSKPIPVNRSVERREGTLPRLRENVFALQTPEGSTGKPYVRARERVFNGAVAVLMGARTVSAAEDFVASFQALGRGKLIGQTTAGSTGQPLQFALPGGGVARITSKHDMLPNGNEFVGKGIAPDIPVPQSVEDIRGQRDPALAVAVEQLSQPVAQSR